jgi:ABC-2 type transport system permease protein
MLADSGIRAQITAPVRAAGSPRTVVAAFNTRKAVRSGVLWGSIFGIAIASSEVSYVKLYKTAVQRQALAATYGTSKAASALFGPAPQLQTVSGFTVFKISMTLMVLGAVWGLLTSTRLLRGEEDSGRWDLLLCGQTTRRGATAQVIVGLGVGLGTLWAVTAIITVLSGLQSSVRISAGASLYFSLTMVATAAMFLAVGALTSQLAATRRQAASFAAVFLGISYGIRLIADAGVGLHGLIWASPLGWVEELSPLTAPQPLAFLPIAAFTVAVGSLAVHLAGRRDVGASIVADRDRGGVHLGLLYGPSGLAIRLLRARVTGWWVAIGLSAFLYGFIAKSTGATVSGSVKEVLSKLGANGNGAAAVFGLCFLLEAILIGFVAAGQVTAVRSEESDGTLDNFLVRPVSRSTWLGGRLLVALVVLVLSGIFAGVLGWLGAASQHTGLSFTSLLEAGINLVPPAIVILGIGVLTFGIRPRATSIVVYTVLGWSLLIVIVGGFGTVGHWVLDTSVFHHMASAPGVPPNWEANGIMTAVGVAAALVGGLAVRRRDLQGA